MTHHTTTSTTTTAKAGGPLAGHQGGEVSQGHAEGGGEGGKAGGGRKGDAIDPGGDGRLADADLLGKGDLGCLSRLLLYQIC